MLTPLHVLLPNTQGLGEVTAELFASEDDVAAESPDLRRPREVREIAGPLIHNFAFMAVILALTCWHVARTDY